MWLRDRIERRALKEDYDLDLSEKQRILEKLNEAVIFEEFLHKNMLVKSDFHLKVERPLFLPSIP